MTSINPSAQFAALEAIIEKTLDPKSKEMRDFKDALLASAIGKLFFNIPVSGKTSSKTKKTNEKKTTDKPKRTMNAYMIYLNEKREEIKVCLLEETPELKGRELANKVTEIAGAAWKQSTELEKQPYLDKAAALKSSAGTKATEAIVPIAATDAVQEQDQADEQEEQVQEEEQEQEQSEEEDDTVKLRHDEALGVWIDDETNLYYAVNDPEQAPLGQVQKNKLIAFKKSK
jgi:hypothetical protein